MSALAPQYFPERPAANAGWQKVRPAIRRIGQILLAMTYNLRRGSDGNLLHGPDGDLVRQCGSGSSCPCGDGTLQCASCPDATPTQYHVTFAGIALCDGCVACGGAGVSFQMGEGGAVGGTYVLAHNGACTWIASSEVVGVTITEYASTSCDGASTPVSFAAQLVRISSSQFLLQITDDSNTILLFSGTFEAPVCCASYTATNELTSCGCGGGSGGATVLGTGGTATVTAC